MRRWPDGGVLAFDLETTGLDRFGDVPVSFALVRRRGGCELWRRSCLVDPGRDIPAGAVAVHGVTTERARREGTPLAAALRSIAGALVEAGADGVPVVGMRLDFDLSIVDHQCRLLDGAGLPERGWRGPALDASVIDRWLDRYRPGRRRLTDLCRHYGVAIETPHDPLADAVAAGDVVAALCRRFPWLGEARPDGLHRLQVGWHRAWATSYSRWRVGRGLAPLRTDELEWPIARRAA